MEPCKKEDAVCFITVYLTCRFNGDRGLLSELSDSRFCPTLRHLLKYENTRNPCAHTQPCTLHLPMPSSFPELVKSREETTPFCWFTIIWFNLGLRGKKRKEEFRSFFFLHACEVTNFKLRLWPIKHINKKYCTGGNLIWMVKMHGIQIFTVKWLN